MSDSPIITISEETVRAEAEAIEAQKKELAARQDRFRKLADYLMASGKGEWIPAAILASAEVQAVVTRYGVAPASSGTWASEIMKIMGNYPDGVVPAELLDGLRTSELREKVESNPGQIYNATAKLVKGGRLTKHNGRLFLPRLYEDYMRRVEKGEIEDYKGSSAGTIADSLVDIISASGGIEAAEIVKKMREMGVAPASVYNNLSKIVQKERVRREGKIYLPIKNEALPEQSESASQITGGEIEPSLPNMGSGND